MTAKRVAMASASSWSWVTMMKVMPTFSCSCDELEAHRLAQLGVERRKRLVQQQHPRPLHQRARQRHALALAAGELIRHALAESRRASPARALPPRACRARPAARRPSSGRRRHCRPPSCAGTPHRTGTPCSPAACWAACRAMSWPSIRIWPSLGVSKPASMRSKRGLAAARGAEQREELACSMSRLTLSTATILPKRLVTSRKLMIGLTSARVPSASFRSTALSLSASSAPGSASRIMPIMRSNGDHDQHGRGGVHLGRHREAHHRIDLHREGDGVRPGGEEGDDEVVERQGERQQRAGDQARLACAARARPRTSAIRRRPGPWPPPPARG